MHAPPQPADRTYFYRSDHRCIVVAHGDGEPSDEEFSAFVDELKRLVRHYGSVRILIHAAGDGSPNAKQRALLADLAASDLRLAVVSDSKLVNVIVTGISWILKRPIRVLPSGEADQALDFLQLSTPEELAVRRMLTEVCTEGDHPLLPI